MHYILGDWKVYPAENKVINIQDLSEFHLAPKTILVLDYFAQNPNAVISIDDLIQNIWDGRIVGDHAVYRVINQLRKHLHSEDKNAYIINIPKKGYKLIRTIKDSNNTESIDSHLGNTTVENTQIEEIKNQQKSFARWFYLAGVFIVAYLIGYFAIPYFKHYNIPQLNQTQPITTQVGNEIDPYFSHDAGFISYSKQSLSVKPFNVYILDRKKNTEHQITDNSANETQAVLSQNASRMVFIRRLKQQCQVILIESPLLDAQEKILFECDWREIDLEMSNDGSTLYYTKATQPSAQHKIFSLTIDTGKTIQLTTIKNVNSQGDRVIALSPDNTQLAFLRDTDWNFSTIGVLKLDQDYQQKTYFTINGWLYALAWSSDNQHIIYQDTNRSLSIFSPETGLKKKITSAFTEDILSISQHGQSNELAIAFGSKENGILSLANPQFDTVSKTPVGNQLNIITQSTEIDTFPNYANNSYRLAFMSKRTGNAQIWLREESGEEKQVSFFEDKRSVRTIRWSPDDKTLLTETESEISTINLSEGSVRALINDGSYGSVGGATWSRDGHSIYFSSDQTGDNQIYQLFLDSGSVKQITQNSGTLAFQSTDGNHLLFLKPHQTGLWRFNLQTGAEELLIEEISDVIHRSIHVFNDGIYYVLLDGDIRYYDYASKQSQTIETSAQLFAPLLSVSYDQKFFAFPQINKTETSIYMLSPEH